MLHYAADDRDYVSAVPVKTVNRASSTVQDIGLHLAAGNITLRCTLRFLPGVCFSAVTTIIGYQVYTALSRWKVMFGGGGHAR